MKSSVNDTKEQVRKLRYSMPGHVHGHDLIAYATDEEILRYSDLKDEIAALWNIAVDRKKRGQIIDENFRREWENTK